VNLLVEQPVLREGSVVHAKHCDGLPTLNFPMAWTSDALYYYLSHQTLPQLQLPTSGVVDLARCIRGSEGGYEQGDGYLVEEEEGE
jgi:hypothetical protein